MLLYAARQFLSAIPTLFGVVTLVFVLVRIVPGDPAIAVLGDAASEQALQAFRERMGLNVPLWQQYLDFLKELASGSLGVSMISGEPVLKSVTRVLPFTLELAAASIFIGAVIGIPLGIWAALKRDTWVDGLLRIVSLLGLSFPSFLMAILLILWLAIGAKLFPVISNPDGGLVDRLYSLFLPALSLGLIMVAYVMRTTRASMIEVLGNDYVRTAKAKGVPRNKVVSRHAMKNAMIPIITVVGLYLGSLIGNAVLIEIVFNRPGLGKLIVLSLNQRDYATLQGLMIVFAFLVVLINVLTDITYVFFDPRVKLS
jgi:ABC-type dipeptide/oligopeptide/nickel transport system permease component